MSTTTVSRLVRATPAEVYRPLTDGAAVGRWRAPDDMTAEVHEFEAVEGGRIRVSLTYDDPERVGKSAGATDTYSGVFVRLDPDRAVVERIAFEAGDTGDPGVAGVMTMTTELEAVPEGTLVTARCEGLPDGIDPADNETGTRMALDSLAALVEQASSTELVERTGSSRGDRPGPIVST